ncbi:MAG TPA: glycerol dehydrogenase [Kiloniellales bacterium]|jgi:quinoprotein glucose dehydrogenase|nr:glycerol dehydrogenase [Kiloniellales bacterium]
MKARRSGFGAWALAVFAVVLVLLGLVLAAGGAWLVALGGSLYYLLAGLGLVISGILMLGDRMAGAWLYLLVFVATVIWALWEVGLDGWGLVPRVVGPLVLAIVVLLFMPVLRRRAAIREVSP